MSKCKCNNNFLLNKTIINTVFNVLKIYVFFLLGQTVMDAMNDRLNSSSPDDGILACCMQVQDRGNTAVSDKF